MPYQNPRSAPQNGPGECPRCHAPVIFCLNANGITQAINRHRVEEWGNQAVRQDQAGRWLVRQLSGDRPTLEGSEALHYPHAPTCTNPAPRASTARRLSSAKVRQGVRPIRQQR
ncbi:hypothetical protein [Streptomyces scabiei]|uniref:hypothetical protein n=1 Tax=Streptomyces scabiei TaxID=1930 RepID=UPI001B335067|nr:MULTISPECIES: hypothetical protein [Streptomyces]MBP5890625.1 hypothetical protein [Streptomyces sp. LBUM 1481]MBP5920757.1 hypothetical protein [Streptomyces sp. LBUM 1483]MDX2538861.1 hypothetical protein [Streptomyces scabiei]MDX2802685.1 hypothetical protein [Streptomyces scabiei]MDX3295013.1 hypothetical protein [Streptomyces scabiei]